MALEISYWTRSKLNQNIPGDCIGAETRTLSGTSAQSGVTPANADYVKLNATENLRFAYTSSNPTAASTSPFMTAGEVAWMDAKGGFKIAGITA